MVVGPLQVLNELVLGLHDDHLLVKLVLELLARLFLVVDLSEHLSLLGSHLERLGVTLHHQFLIVSHLRSLD